MEFAKRNAPTLLLDCHSILHAARYSIKKQVTTKEEAERALIYSFISHINMLVTKFATDKFVFAWDTDVSIRKEKFPFYKQRKPASSASATEMEIDLHTIYTFDTIRNQIIPWLGFTHNHYYRGYEADDIIAAAVTNNKGNFIVVSSDHDLMQLLHSCSLYIHRDGSLYTDRMFVAEYRIDCSLWAEVKAIAGCSSDTIPGIAGVGEKTAIKFILNELKETTKAYKNIVSPEGQRTIKRNRELVYLPLQDCPIPDLDYRASLSGHKESEPHTLDKISETYKLGIGPTTFSALRSIL